MQPVIAPLGNSAITVTFGSTINEQINKKVLSLFSYLKQQNIHGIKDIIPAYASLTISYDMMKVIEQGEGSPYQQMHDVIQQALQHKAEIDAASRTIQVPVCYDISLGSDLIKISRQKFIDVDEIIHIHSSTTYRVYMIGFLPGFAYMGTVDERIVTPRKATPTQSIAAGSVGIADAQTGIYPLTSPGGWNIVGQTPTQLFNPNSDDPCFFHPGDVVQFIPITLEEFNKMKQP